MIDINHYPYGKASLTLKKAVSWLNQNQYEGDFDFPDYGHMPKMISENLSPDDVDWIQEELYKLRKY